jgi:hypothetical protein
LILTAEIEASLVSMIEGNPEIPVLLPDWAYAKSGRVIVLVDGLPIDLHRHFHNTLIRPLAWNERMWDQSGVAGNVNPHLFQVIEGRRTPATHCRNGHPYEGNEMAPNTSRYRCAICYRASRPHSETYIPPAQRTHCPRNHEYTPENTIRNADGKRRCRVCTNDRKAAAMRRRRKENQ